MIDALLFFIVKECLFLLGFIAGRSSFPKPLTREQEAECLEAMQKKDESAEIARKTLIEHNLRLVVHVARKYTVPGCTQEDLVHIGAMGLIKAIETYKQGSGTALATYAARCVENEILMALRAAKKRRGDVSLSEPIGTDGEGNDISFMDILGTAGDVVEEEVHKRVTMGRVRCLLKRLPKRERIVLELRYGILDGRAHHQHEIAKNLNISRSYVSRVEKHAIQMIRDWLQRGEG